MAVRVQAVGVFKVAARAAELCGLVVHHPGKARLRAADVLGQHVGRVVGRLHERGVQHVLERDFLARHKRDVGRVPLDVDGGIRDRGRLG